MIEPLGVAHFHDVIALGNSVHGDGYLDHQTLEKMLKMGTKAGVNASFVAISDQQQLLGFRLTYSAEQWEVDKWCSPQKWQAPIDKVCYFKCNTVAEHARGFGLGGKLLAASIAATKRQGAIAGVSHLWKQSPNNSAVRYFTKAGGEFIHEHANRWNTQGLDSEYLCVLCGEHCRCSAVEMLLRY